MEFLHWETIDGWEICWPHCVAGETPGSELGSARSELAALSFPRIVTWPASSAQFVPSLRLSQAYENEWGRVTA